MTTHSVMITPGATIAVAGASGYVGGRLVPSLLSAGYRVRCLVRETRKARSRPWAEDKSIEIVECRLDDEGQTALPLTGCEAAYYLVHTMVSAGTNYARHDEALARTFGLAARRASVKRVIYLGGLGEVSAELSEHLASRRNVEAALRCGGVPVTTLRAAMIIGAGSASFEILRYLVERLPIMITPRWVRTQSQPIAISDVIRYLTACLTTPETTGRDLDIGGTDVVTYDTLMRVMARQLGLRSRIVIPVRVLTPGLSSRWIHLITPIGHRLAKPLAEGLRNRLVCRNDDAAKLMPGERLSATQAIERALADHRTGRAPTSWTDAGPMPGDPEWAGGKDFVDRRERLVWATESQVFDVINRIGGRQGYYGAGALWRLRGWMDRLIGGPGLRRGRRDPDALRFGDTVDFWRVTGLEPPHRIELTAEMRLPGKATLEWTVEPRPGGRSLLVQTARFRPRGLLGLAYWWGVWPVHGIVFDDMIRGVSRMAEAKGPGTPTGRPTRGLRLIRREQIVPQDLTETFAFFSDARNLEALTPPWVGFEIMTPMPVRMQAGTTIDYRIRIRGITTRWRTRITTWEPHERFIDVQTTGPYRWWHHEHRFEACEDGTRIIDEVEYRAPLGWLTHRLLVDRDVRRIFDYREHAMNSIAADRTPLRNKNIGRPLAAAQ